MKDRDLYLDMMITSREDMCVRAGSVYITSTSMDGKTVDYNVASVCTFGSYHIQKYRYHYGDVLINMMFDNMNLLSSFNRYFIIKCGV